MLIATVPFSDRRSFLFFYVFAEERLSFAEESGDDGHKDDRRDDALCQYGTGKSKVDLINGTLSESGTAAISIDLFGVISNIIRIPENKKVPE